MSVVNVCANCGTSYPENAMHECPGYNLELSSAMPNAYSLAQADPYLIVNHDWMQHRIKVTLDLRNGSLPESMYFNQEVIANMSKSELYSTLCFSFKWAIYQYPKVEKLIDTVVHKSFDSKHDYYITSGPMHYGTNPAAEVTGGGRPKELDQWRFLGESVMCGDKDCETHPYPSSLETVIIQLNDYHKWTREQIADWLETLDVDIRINPKENANEQQDR